MPQPDSRIACKRRGTKRICERVIKRFEVLLPRHTCARAQAHLPQTKWNRKEPSKENCLQQFKNIQQWLRQDPIDLVPMLTLWAGLGQGSSRAPGTCRWPQGSTGAGRADSSRSWSRLQQRLLGQTGVKGERAQWAHGAKVRCTSAEHAWQHLCTCM